VEAELKATGKAIRAIRIDSTGKHLSKKPGSCPVLPEYLHALVNAARAKNVEPKRET
jgi:hypothetical protein